MSGYGIGEHGMAGMPQQVARQEFAGFWNIKRITDFQNTVHLDRNRPTVEDSFIKLPKIEIKGFNEIDELDSVLGSF